MSLTQAISSKANIKKTTSADVPYSPALPVLNKYESTSSAGQTIVNLPFIVDLSYVDGFQIYVDGKLLRYGASNDFTFTSVNADNTSSQVTLTTSLPASLNIIALKLGAKKESEFGSDNRFAALYENLGSSLQGFVDEKASVLTASSSMPTGQLGGSGVFRSSITGRAPITDLSQDLKASMGVERISVQSIYQLQDEFGPTGQPVWAAVNDSRGLIRFVGGGWSNENNDSGQRAVVLAPDATAPYCEITFYGTGLNWLTIPYNSAMNVVYSVDGGSDSSNILPAAYSSILTLRKTNENQIVPIVSGLTLGIHTVIIKKNGTGANLDVMGFEVLNESSTVKVNPGVAYIKGQKYSLTAAQSLPYNSTFESGALGSKGGRVLVYQKSDGSIAKAVTPTDSTALYLSSANHQNEEVARTYYFREFGAGRTDDFSTLTGSSSTKAFTLEDGTTTLVGSSVNLNQAVGFPEGLYLSTSGSFWTFTFIGTGIDIVQYDSGSGTDTTLQLAIDGSSAGTYTTGNVSMRTVKVASGLPYGTHTVKLTRAAGSTLIPTIVKFLVYQPKKPSLPSGAVELADYNVIANFVANATATPENVATGVLRKHTAQRETIFVNGTGGTTDWTMSGPGTGNMGGWQNYSDKLNSYIQYTFFGTGFDFRFPATSNATANAAVTLNGTALNASYSGAGSITCSVYGTGVTFGGQGPNSSFLLSAVSSNVLDQLDAATTNGSGFRVSGLPLGLYTLKINNGTAGQFLYNGCLDVITPIHSPKSNLYADLQNTLPVGSCAISDNRKTSAIKESLPAQKARAQAVGVFYNPTTTSTTNVPCPDLSCTIKIANSGFIDVSYMFDAYCSVADYAYGQIYVNGVAQGTRKRFNFLSATSPAFISDRIIIPVSAGTHKVDVYYATASGTLTSGGTFRNLTVVEL